MPAAKKTERRFLIRVRWRSLGHFGLCLFAASLSLSVAGANIGWGACLLALLADPGTRPGLLPRIKADPLLLPWVLFLSAALLCCIFGVDFRNGLPMLRVDLGKAIVYFVLVAAAAAYGRGRAAAWYLAGACVAALWGIRQTFISSELYAHASVHHVTYGELISAALALYFSRFAFARSRYENLIAVAAIVLLSAALALSQARGAWLGAAVSLACATFFYAPGRRKLLLVAAAFLLLAAGIRASSRRFHTAAALSDRAATILSTRYRSNEIRLISWKVGWRIFKDHPLFGAGLRNVREVFSRYYSEPIEGESNWGNLHNLYIHQLAERGVVGGLALLYLFSAFALLAWRRWKERPDPYRLWAVALLPAFFLMNLTETSFQHEIIAYVIAWVLASGI